MPFATHCRWRTLCVYQYLLITIPAADKGIFVRGYNSSLILSRRNFVPVLQFSPKRSFSHIPPENKDLSANSNVNSKKSENKFKSASFSILNSRSELNFEGLKIFIQSVLKGILAFLPHLPGIVVTRHYSFSDGDTPLPLARYKLYILFMLVSSIYISTLSVIIIYLNVLNIFTLLCSIYMTQYVYTGVKNSCRPSLDQLITFEKSMFLLYSIALVWCFNGFAHLVPVQKILTGLATNEIRSHAVFYFLYITGLTLALLTGLWVRCPWKIGWNHWRNDLLLRNLRPQKLIKKLQVFLALESVFLFGILFNQRITDYIFFASLAAWFAGLANLTETGLIQDTFVSVSSLLILGIGNILSLLAIKRKKNLVVMLEQILSPQGLYSIVGNYPFSHVSNRAKGIGISIVIALGLYDLHEKEITTRVRGDHEVRDKGIEGNYWICRDEGGSYEDCKHILQDKLKPMHIAPKSTYGWGDIFDWLSNKRVTVKREYSFTEVTPGDSSPVAATSKGTPYERQVSNIEKGTG